MPFHHLYNLIKRSQIKIKAVGTPCRNLLHIIRAGNQAFPRLTIIFRTLPRNKPVLFLIMIPEKNSSFIQSYPNIGFGSICFYIKSGSGHSHFHPLQIHLIPETVVSKLLGDSESKIRGFTSIEEFEKARQELIGGET